MFLEREKGLLSAGHVSAMPLLGFHLLWDQSIKSRMKKTHGLQQQQQQQHGQQQQQQQPQK